MDFKKLFGREPSALIYGCMGLGGGWDKEEWDEGDYAVAEAAVEAALAGGINFFDHADIYSRTKAEAVFGEVLARNPGMRGRMIVQTKCGIRLGDTPVPGMPGRYDMGREWILEAARASLGRLRCGAIDVLLLHRPDPLLEVAEVAAAFRQLRKEGTVRAFGVSNMNRFQMAALQEALAKDRIPLVANQLEFSLLKADLIETGISVNQRPWAPAPWKGEFDSGAGTAAAAFSPGVDGLLEHCRATGVMVQTWGSLAQGRLTGRKGPGRGGAAAKGSEGDAALGKASALVAELAEKRGVAPEAILLAWVLRVPGGLRPLVGSANPERIKAACAAAKVQLSREDWYRLWIAARGAGMP